MQIFTNVIQRALWLALLSCLTCNSYVVAYEGGCHDCHRRRCKEHEEHHHKHHRHHKHHHKHREHHHKQHKHQEHHQTHQEHCHCHEEKSCESKKHSACYRCEVHELAERLENEMWHAIQFHDREKIRENISDIFFAGRTNGTVSDRCDEIERLERMRLRNYEIHDLQAHLSESGKVLVIAYRFVAHFEERRQADGLRMSVWKKGDNGWQWASHSNFEVL